MCEWAKLCDLYKCINVAWSNKIPLLQWTKCRQQKGQKLELTKLTGLSFLVLRHICERAEWQLDHVISKYWRQDLLILPPKTMISKEYINIWSKHKTDTWHLCGIQIMCVGLVDDYLRNYAIVYWVNFWTVIFSIFKWLSIMLNSSCGDGIRPVSNLDHAGISFIDISNAPEAISCREFFFF